MNKFSKVIAFALAATMVVGSSLTAFADDPVYDSTGAGISEGHVDKKKTNVILPTTVANTTFAFTMDPEKLIEQTAHGKYGDDVVFPEAEDDTYVYFNNGPDSNGKTVYANTSAAVTITNKSSHDIDLTVEATAVATTTEGKVDIPLVAKDAYKTAANPSLYLGLVVGEEDAVAIVSETPASQTVTVAGTEANFKIAVKGDKSGYEYRELTLAEYQALDGNSSKTQDDFDDSWEKTLITLEGGVTTGKAITADTTAPSVKVTWSWVDPTANAAPSATATQAILEAGKTADIAVNLGLGDLAATGVSKLINKGLGNDWIAAGAATYSNGKITLTKTSDVDYLLGAGAANNVFTIEFNDAAKTKVDVTLTAKE